MPLASEEPDLLVDSDLPALGSAVPVIIERDNMPRNELPSLGTWVKLKVVGVMAVQVKVEAGCAFVAGPCVSLANAPVQILLLLLCCHQSPACNTACFTK